LDNWYEQFNRLAGDLYPGRYSREYVRDLVAIASEVRTLAQTEQSLILAHNYVYPELQEVADAVGDSLGLSRLVHEKKSRRVHFCGVWFMGETAKIIAGNRCRVFMPDDRAGCSLVDSIEHRRVADWIAEHPKGIVISYINSDAFTKALSHCTCTSANAAKVVRYAVRTWPGRRILFLPDKYLGTVALAGAQIREAFDYVDFYDGSCHVHAAIDREAIETALDRFPEAEPLIHPECACVLFTLSEGAAGTSRIANTTFLSTEQMLQRARISQAREFIVATEVGMVYRLRKELPNKIFHPISQSVVCEYMKMNTLEKLLNSLQRNVSEVEVDPDTSKKARVPIRRMLSIT
jgi:quinolinate synthase